MSAKVWCRLGDGTEHEELHATEEEGKQALNRTLERHKLKGHNITEQQSDHDGGIQYLVKDTSGSLVAMYQIIE